jgi:hypothetical protein
MSQLRPEQAWVLRQAQVQWRRVQQLQLVRRRRRRRARRRKKRQVGRQESARVDEHSPTQ